VRRTAIIVSLGLVCGCGSSPVEPTANVVESSVAPPASKPATPRDLRSLSGSYSVIASITRADSDLGCDPRRPGITEPLGIVLHVDGDTRMVEADVLRSPTGQTSHFRGTVDDSYTVRASSGSSGQAATGADCAGSASETLTMRFLGPNYDFCQGFSGQIEIGYSSLAGAIVEMFRQVSC
jgi:hypothetical protein